MQQLEHRLYSIRYIDDMFGYFEKFSFHQQYLILSLGLIASTILFYLSPNINIIFKFKLNDYVSNETSISQNCKVVQKSVLDM